MLTWIDATKLTWMAVGFVMGFDVALFVVLVLREHVWEEED